MEENTMTKIFDEFDIFIEGKTKEQRKNIELKIHAMISEINEPIYLKKKEKREINIGLMMGELKVIANEHIPSGQVWINKDDFNRANK